MAYPDSFLRGISDKSLINEDGSVCSAVFHFWGKKNLPEREDYCHEESIFWKDDDGAIYLILSQKKEDGNLQFKSGAVLVDRQLFDELRKFPHIKPYLSYERKFSEDNPYHGNLLLKKSVDKFTMKNIAGAIAACCCTDYIPQK